MLENDDRGAEFGFEPAEAPVGDNAEDATGAGPEGPELVWVTENVFSAVSFGKFVNGLVVSFIIGVQRMIPQDRPLQIERQALHERLGLQHESRASRVVASDSLKP